jgi:hypothetical protein
VQQGIFNVRQGIFNVQRSIFNVQRGIFNMQQGIVNVQQGIVDVQGGIFNVQWGTDDVQWGSKEADGSPVAAAYPFANNDLVSVIAFSSSTSLVGAGGFHRRFTLRFRRPPPRLVFGVIS